MDYEALRTYLMDYFGTAMTNGNPMAVMELQRVESASDEEILQIAMENGIEV